MYYPDGAGLFGEELVRLPDGRVVTYEEAQRLNVNRWTQGIPSTPKLRAPTISSPMAPANQLMRQDLDRWTQGIPRTSPASGPNVQPPMAPPTPARTAPIPTAQPKAPVYPPNPALMAAEAGASTPKPEEPSGFGGILDWMGKNPEKKQSFDQSDVLMALGSGMLGLSADPNLQKLGAAGFGQVAERRDERKTTAMTNRTVDALIGSGMIKPEQADILRNNPALIKEVYAAALKGDDAAIAKYKWLLDNPEQAAKLKELGAIGGGVNIDLGAKGDDAYFKEFAVGSAKAVNAAADELPKLLEQRSQIALLQRLGAEMDAGATLVPAFLREAIPQGFSTTIDAYRGIAYGVAQNMRVEGTGAQSERDFDILLQRAGAANATPQARQIIQAGLQNALQMKIDLARAADSYRMADPSNPAEQKAARTAYFKQREEILNRRLFTEEQLKVLGVEAPEDEREKLFEVLPYEG